MRFDLLTIFPGYFASPLSEALVGKAIGDGLIDVRVVDLRPFSDDPHRKVDDEAFGGGPGMVLTAPPLFAAIEALRAEEGAPPPHVLYLSPRGRRLDAAFARELAAFPRLVLVCGRYEGVDERVRAYVDDELSLGDFVLTGGEPAALAMIDAVVRLLPGALGNAESASTESHGDDGMLEYPQYTRPVDFRGALVPEVLRCGDHARVARWRRWHSLRRTRERRPDLFNRAKLGREDQKLIDGDEP